MTFDYGTPIGSLTPPAALRAGPVMVAIQSEGGGAQAPHGEQRVDGPALIVRDRRGAASTMVFQLSGPPATTDTSPAVGVFGLLQDLGFALVATLEASSAAVARLEGDGDEPVSLGVRAVLTADRPRRMAGPCAATATHALPYRPFFAAARHPTFPVTEARRRGPRDTESEP